MMKKFSLVAVFFAMGLTVRGQLDFQDPNTSFYSVENFSYATASGDFEPYRGSGFYSAGKGGLPPRVFLLPGIFVDRKKIEAIDKVGRIIDFRYVDDGAQLSSIRIPVTYRDPLPNDEVGAGIMASISGKPLTHLEPRPLLDPNNQPIIFAPARMNGMMVNAVMTDTNQQRARVTEQQPFIDQWSKAQSEKAACTSLEVAILMDGDEVTSRQFSGAMITSGGKLATLSIRNPDTLTLNRIREGTFEVKCSYTFKDANVGSINATYDFRRFMSEFIERSRSAVTSSRSSGFKIFGIGSRKSSIRTFIKESSRDNTVVDEKTKTVIEFEDADQEMIDRFDAQFFPSLSKERTIENHLAAARQAEQTGNKELAKAHLDYVTGLRDDNKDAAIDAVGAAASLGSGNYAMFIAKGVRFHNDNDRISDSYHQVLSASVTEGASKEWTSRVLRSRQRSVSVLLDPEDSDAGDTWFGLYGARGVPVPSKFGVKQFLLLTCVAEGSPLHRSGLTPGMLISEIDGKEIHSIKDLDQIFAKKNPGDDVIVSILGADNISTVDYSVTLARGPRR